MPLSSNTQHLEHIHQFIVNELSLVQAIIKTMSSKSIMAFDQYINNFEKVAFFYGTVEPYMKDENFISYLKKNDIDTFIQVDSLGNSILLISNLLFNLEKYFKDRMLQD